MRRPGFTAAAVISLVLGIGTNTAIFTVLDAVFLRPLPVADSHELVAVSQALRNEAGEYEGDFSISWPNYLHYREHNRTLSGLAAYHWGRMNFSGGSEPQRATGMFVTPNYFDVLGVRPALGRFMQEEDWILGASTAAILSHGCCRRLFGGDPDILDQEVLINGHRFTLVGVGPPGFKGTEINVSVDFWVAIGMFERLSPYAYYFENRGVALFRTIGRRSPESSLAQVSEEMLGLAQQLSQEYPNELKGLGAQAQPLVDGVIRAQDRGRYRNYMRTLVVAVALILLIACISVVNLLLVRGMERAREVSVRQAMGADRPSQRPAWMKLAGLGFELAAAVVGFSFLGYWLGGYFGSAPLGLVIGSLIGLTGGMYNLLRVYLATSRRSDQNSRASHRKKHG